jgi:hypothetical protein
MQNQIMNGQIIATFWIYLGKRKKDVHLHTTRDFT